MDASTFFNVLLIGAALHGIFLSLVLQTLHNRNKNANKILSLILLISTLMLAGRLILMQYQFDWLRYVGAFADNTIFVFGPLVYIYVRRLIFTESKPYRLGMLHYVPLTLHMIFCLWFFTLSKAEASDAYQNGPLSYFYFVIEGAGILLLIFYVVRSFLILKKYRANFEKELSNPQAVASFLKVFLSILGVCSILWLCSFLNVYFIQVDLLFLSYNSMWIAISIFVYSLGYYSLRQPEIFRIPIKPSAKEKERLKPEEVNRLQKRLHYFMNSEETFLQSDLTLTQLSEKLHTSPNNLSWLLNNVYNTTFYTYINDLRIDKFISKIEQGAHHKVTLLSIAMDVGFNSKSTFNKVFKNKMGITPSSYIKKQQVA